MRENRIEPVRAAWLVSCAMLLALGGCYEAHLLDGTVAPGDDAALLGDASGDDGGLGFDSGLPVFDAGPRDAGVPVLDAGPRDAGVPVLDAGLRDGGVRDAGVRDAGVRDAGVRDAGVRDAGVRDAGVRDAGVRDAGVRDAGVRDAGVRDAGLRDASVRDAGAGDGGRRSVALRFSDTTFVTVPDRPGLRVGVDSTYEMWMRARGPGLVSSKGQDGGQRHLSLEIATGPDGRLELIAGWVTVTLAPRQLRVPLDATVLGRWTHVAFVVARIGSQLQARLYVDFALAATGTFPNDIGDAFNTEPLRLGRFDGDLDEVRVWRTVRGEATLFATAFTRISSGTPTLAAYWPIEEAPSQLVLDRSLLGSDGFRGIVTSPDPADPTWIFDGAL